MHSPPQTPLPSSPRVVTCTRTGCDGSCFAMSPRRIPARGMKWQEVPRSVMRERSLLGGRGGRGKGDTRCVAVALCYAP